MECASLYRIKAAEGTGKTSQWSQVAGYLYDRSIHVADYLPNQPTIACGYLCSETPLLFPGVTTSHTSSYLRCLVIYDMRLVATQLRP